MRIRPLTCLVAAALASPVFALDGQPGIHDPATVIESKGHFYTWGTGGGLPGLVSDDGWAWRSNGSLFSAVPGGKPGPDVIALGGNNSWAPDVIHVGDKFFVYYAAPGTQPKAAVGLLVGRSLDPQSPDYKWEDGGPVASSDGIEDSNAIDPGVLLDADGRLWLVYGSYFGYIRLVELNPKTGKRLDPKSVPVNVAINSEAPVLIQHDGWYYLLVTHGSCCNGANSTYNIRVGRSRKVTGPYLDNMGIDMIEGGGKLFAGSRGRHVGPGHFGLLDLGDGVQKFSMHYEADLDRGGASVLDIRPIMWRDGWPVAGDNFEAGTYSIESARTGTVLELAVQGVAVGGARGRGAGAGGGGAPGGAGGRGAGAGGPGGRGAGASNDGGPPAGAAPGGAPGGGRGFGAGTGGGAPGGGGGGQRGAAPATPVADQTASQVSTNWPTGNIDLRLSQAMLQAQQKWTIEPVPNVGGYPGSAFLKITIAGTGRALAATRERELTTVAEFTGAPEQLWRIDQLADGSYRVMPKAIPGTNEALALTAIGSSMPTLEKFDPASDRQRWNIRAP
jgi:arabinan endo-1,5-alpha-L-arabinosidase